MEYYIKQLLQALYYASEYSTDDTIFITIADRLNSAYGDL